MTTPATLQDASAPPAERLLGELLLTAEEAGAVLHVTAETVKHLHRMGRLQAVRVGKENRWKPETLRTFVAGLEPEKDS